MTPIVAICIFTLLYAFHYALPLYAESSFLNTLISTEYIGVMYSIAALLSFGATFLASAPIRRVGVKNVIILTTITEVAVLVLLGTLTNPTFLLALFVLRAVLVGILFFCLHVLVESISTDEKTGSLRGVFLTVLNVGILTSPFFASQLVQNGFSFLFFISATSILCALLFLLYIPNTASRELSVKKEGLRALIRKLVREKDTARIIYSQFLLELFFVLMVVYTPLYLIENNIATLAQYLGIILPIALIPFIILPYPLGMLADKKYGEKEMLLFGFALMSLGVITFVIIPQMTILIAALILFVTRVGASMLEEMNSSYFYKHVDSNAVLMISLFNNTRNAALIIGPLLASAILFVTESFSLLFILFGCMLLVGALPLFKLHDTK